ncbi:MAG: class I SAM-dependent methyltransferase [Oscillospiraceae bacterium]|jgi:SAM-dependent methyltransferase|nr:class I SAM-dependent methyltransferase [Oscillospiraceae bacterium]
MSEIKDLEYFKSLWEARQSGPVDHSPDIWDERAKEWIGVLGALDGVEGGAEDEVRARSMRARVDSTSSYLRSRGVLDENTHVVDVGCGPGLFVAEFAKTARRSVGIDYSARFIEYAARRAESLGFTNASFDCLDFFALDVDEAGLTGAFDLVFTSITPAASGRGCLEKLIKMSRAWCYNASFVHASDSLAERVSREVFGHEFRSRWDGGGFYALFNLLWHLGYSPETYFFDDDRTELITPSLRAARRCASDCGEYGDEAADEVLCYLKAHGSGIERRSSFRYGSVLWDTRVRFNR